MKLTLDKANVIADKTLAKARDAKYRPMCVAVLDDGGHLKVLKREDAASIRRSRAAVSSARADSGIPSASEPASTSGSRWAAASSRPRAPGISTAANDPPRASLAAWATASSVAASERCSARADAIP